MAYCESSRVHRAVVRLPVQPTVHQYKFVLNNADWQLDPEKPTRREDSGIFNNLLDIPYLLGLGVASSMLTTKEFDCPTQGERQFDSFVLTFDPAAVSYPWHGSWRMLIAAPSCVLTTLDENAPAPTPGSPDKPGTPCAFGVGVGDTYWSGAWRICADLSARVGYPRYLIRFETRSRLTITPGQNKEELMEESGIKPLSIRFGALTGLNESPPHFSFTSNIGTRFVGKDSPATVLALSPSTASSFAERTSS